MTQFICGGEKYQVYGPKADTIWLPVSPQGLPASIEIEGYTLTLRDDFHVTLVGIGKIIEKHGVTDSDFVSKVSQDFCAFVQNNPIEFLRYSGEYRFMASNDRRSVVAMAEVSNLDKFFEQLNTKYNLKLEYPPTHVTLYTLPGGLGIFMVDQDALQKLSKVIPAPVKL